MRNPISTFKDFLCRWLTGFTVTEVESIWQSRETFRRKYLELKKKQMITK